MALVLPALLAAACAAEIDQPDVGRTGAAVTAQPDPSCTYAQNAGREYWVCSAARRWQEAKTTCESVGMQLAKPDTLAENDFIRSRIPADSWLGGSDLAVENAWRWSDGNVQFWSGRANGSAQNGQFTRWKIGEPNDLLGEDCLLMVRSDGRWNDTICTLNHAFVCEQTAATAAQPQAPDTACQHHVRNGVEYWTCSNARTWDAARAQCQAVGMDLAEIDDAGEAAFLRTRIGGDAYIGLTDRDEDGVWRGTQTGRLSFCGGADGRRPGDAYANWAPGEPVQSNRCQRASAPGKGYWICENTLSWTAARDQCAASGMTLARIDDAAENALITAHIRHDTWTGANDRTSEGRWVWADDTHFWQGAGSGSPVSGRYHNWYPFEPNNLFNEDCAVIDDGTGKWRDEPCDQPVCAPGFVCEGPENAPYPDLNDCAFMQASGSWRAGSCAATRGYVCERLAADAGTALEDQLESIREDHQLGAPRATDLQFRADAGVTQPFLRGEKRLGLRACLDTIEPISEPRLRGDVEQVQYGQFYRGIPVFGRGYAVLRDPDTHVVISATGTITPNLAVATDVVVGEPEAWGLAVAAVDAAPWALFDLSIAPGELVLMPKTQGRDPEYELSWLFEVPAASGPDSYDVAISARDGSVVMSRHSFDQQCVPAFLPPAGTPTVSELLPVTNTPQTAANYPDRQSALTTRRATSTGPLMLYSAGASNEPDSAVRTKPITHAMCRGNTDVIDKSLAVSVPNAPMSVGANPTEGAAAASFYLAMQTCLEVFAERFRTAEGAPWIGTDGTGDSPVELIVHPTGTFPAKLGWSGATNTIEFDPGMRPWPGASVEAICHELGHALFHHFVDPQPAAPSRPHWGLEAQALNEGFADVMAAFAEIEVRKPDLSTAFCILGDGHPGCWHDLSIPEHSSGPECNYTSVVKAAAGCPSRYMSAPFCRSNIECASSLQGDCCDVHTNATILGHWFYLLTYGSLPVDEACGITVEKLDPDPVDAARLAAKLLFETLRDGHMPLGGGYEDLANATITKALNTPGVSVESVVAAWALLNVRERYYEAPEHAVFPGRSTNTVNPWVLFEWPREGETAWDFQLGRNGAFTGTDLLYEAKNVRRSFGDKAMFKLALPENHTEHYTWRVRKAAGDAPWADCHPVHWFDNTGTVLPTLFKLENLDETGRPRPGTIEVELQTVRGAAGYVVFLSDQDNGCTSGSSSDVAEVEADEEYETTRSATLEGAQADTDYYIQIRTVGPRALGGGPAPTKCVTRQFRTGALPPAELLEPADGSVHDIAPPHGGPTPELSFRWRVRGAAGRSEISFFPIVNGQCDRSQPPIVRQAAQQCAFDTCVITAGSEVWPPVHAGGYCWQVTTFARSGTAQSTSPERRFYYGLGLVTGQAPGAQAGLIEADPAVGADWLPNRVFDRPVEFSWDPYPGAASYGFKLGRWPWRKPTGTPDPANCIGPFCNLEPVEVTVPTRSGIQETALTLPGQLAGRGRYCYQVWPELAGARVAGPASYCYTTPPAYPKPTVSTELPLVGFSSDPIRGEVLFPYLPHGTAPRITGEMTLEEASAECTPVVEHVPSEWVPGENWLYNDRYDCTIPFVIETPLENHTYNIKAQVVREGSTQSIQLHPADSSPSLVEQTLTLVTRACGADGEPCCQDGGCDEANIQCVPDTAEGPTCMTCGGIGEACCPGERCNNTIDATCESNTNGHKTCKLGCGLAGQRCCSFGCRNGAACGANGLCPDCGGLGEPCCIDRGCDSAYACNAQTFLCESRGSVPVADGLTITATGQCPGAVAVTFGNHTSRNYPQFLTAFTCDEGGQTTDLQFGTCGPLAPGQSCTFSSSAVTCNGLIMVGASEQTVPSTYYGGGMMVCAGAAREFGIPQQFGSWGP